MPLSKRKMGLVLGLITLAIIGAIINAVMQTSEPVTTDPNASTTSRNSDTTMVGEGVSFVVTEGEIKKWEIRAEQANYYPDDSGADLVNVTGEFFDESGVPILSFKAPEGSTTNKNEVELRGGVIITSIGKNTDEAGPDVGDSNATAKTTQEQTTPQDTNPNGSRLTAPTVSWNTRSDFVEASGGIHVASQGFAVSKSERCKFSLDFSTVELGGDAYSEIKM